MNPLVKGVSGCRYVLSLEAKSMKRRIYDIMCAHLMKINELQPTDDEIYEFVKDNGMYGIVTSGDGKDVFRLPFVHETWRTKWGGRTHIDMSDSKNEYHLMLDRCGAPYFIECIEKMRAYGHDN